MKVEDILVIAFLVGAVCFMPTFTSADEAADSNLRGSKFSSKTDDDVASREEQKVSHDGFSVAEKKLMENAESFTFQAEVNRLMGIIINSLYSNKEIFLRELISNASDALDKIRYMSLTNAGALGEGDTAKLEIRIKADPDSKMLHIIDRGVGMTKKDLIGNLGTIAQSGTKEFLKKVQDGNDASGGMNLIGQFGVGFYSCFLVADRVTVTSKHNDDKQYIWESTASDTFTVVEDPRGNTLGRGTQISLQLKEDQEDYLQIETLKKVVSKYSEFINYPIYLWTSHEEEREIVEEPAEEEEKKEPETDEERVKIEEEEADKKEKKTKTVKETVWNWTLVNESKPIWTRPSKEITAEEYNSFYKALTKDQADPLHHVHFLGEGEVDFKSILYIPANPSESLYETKPKDQKTPSLKLYVRRVFITDTLDDLLPKYLLFLKGVVDSDDLPLNVSREIFQQNKSLDVIRKKLVRKAIAMFQSLAEDTSAEGKEKWNTFYKNYSTSLKWGAMEDRLNRTRLSKLLRFHSSKTGELTSFDDYVSRMKEGQKDIYWLAGDSKEVLEKSPLVEKLIKRGYEVLFMVDPIDEYTMQAMEKFDGKHRLTNVGREGIQLDEDKKEEADAAEQFKQLTEFLGKQLSGKIEKAVVSTRLTKTPSALVAGQYGYTAHQEKIVKAQALGSDKSTAFMKARKIMEVNHRHPIIIELNRRVTENAEDATAKDIADLLFETAALHSGFQLEEPAAFAGRIHRMMKLSLNLDPEAEADLSEPAPAEPKAAEEPEEAKLEKEEL